MILVSASPTSKNECLGTIGKSFPKTPANDSITKVFHALKPNQAKGSDDAFEQKKNYQKSRHHRYDLQRTLIDLFKGKQTPKGASFNFHNCKLTPVSVEGGKPSRNSKTGDGSVDIVYSFASETASYTKLQTCQKGNSCPHCAEVKALENKKQLEAMTACHIKAGGSILMMTLTNSHHIGHKLEYLMSGQSDALKRFNKSLSNDAFYQEFGGRVGAVRAWEITYGANGWHPHFHFLLYMNDDLVERDEKGKPLESQPTLDVMRNSLAELWQESCVKAGLPAPSLEHGVDIRDGSHAEKYIGKFGDEIINMKNGWGASDELAKPHLKTDKKPPKSLDTATVGEKGVTPWQLLELAHNGCEKSGKLFIEYTYATYGRAQLYWYQGTKKLYDLDSEIMEMQRQQDALTAEKFDDRIIPDDRLFITLPFLTWRAIVHCNRRSELLITAEFDASNGDFEHRYTTQALINQCLKKYFEDLVIAKNGAKIEIDRQLKKSEADPPNIKLSKLTEHQKTVKKRYGLKGMAYGLELCEAMDKLQEKQAKSNLPPIPPSWIIDAPMFDEMPLMPPIVNNCNYSYDEYYQ